MTDDATPDPGMPQHMLLCCGIMTLTLGALGISSVAAAVGLTTSQTYLTVAGFVIAAGAVIVHRYRKQSPTENSPLNLLDDGERELQ